MEGAEEHENYDTTFFLSFLNSVYISILLQNTAAAFLLSIQAESFTFIGALRETTKLLSMFFLL